MAKSAIKSPEGKTLCPHCRAEVDPKASRCPHCQGKIHQWTLGKIVVASIVGLFVFAFILGSVSDSPSGSGSTNTESVSANTPPADQLELVSFNCYEEYDYFHITGQVKNISGKSMESVVAVGNAYTEEGEFVKSDDALIDYNPILAGQTSPFEVLMTGNPAISKCSVAFKEFWGGTISTKKTAKEE